MSEPRTTGEYLCNSWPFCFKHDRMPPQLPPTKESALRYGAVQSRADVAERKP